jgi:hypothetical protein
MELWPASKITAQVHVMNGGKEPGPGSTPPLEFETPEGPPGPVSNLRIPEKGSSHVKVEWDPPAEPNGNVTGYKVFYKPGKVSSNCLQPATTKQDQVCYHHHRHYYYYLLCFAEDGDEWQELPIEDPNQQSVKIKDLKPDTPYEIKVAAVTQPGPGDELKKQVSTRPPVCKHRYRYLPGFGDFELKLYQDNRVLMFAAPDKPYIGNIEHGESSLNVSFVPTLNPEDPNANPGQDLTVKYRKSGDCLRNVMCC